MFKLHIYNPEHDIALGKNSDSFTPPKAARITRDAYWYIPALWADDGDWVLKGNLTPNPSPKGEGSERIVDYPTNVRFVTWEDLAKLTKEEMPSKVEPWGWDKLIVSQLVKCNPLFKSLVPSEKELDVIRQLSSREFAATHILPRLVSKSNDFIGYSKVFRGTVEELSDLIKNSGSIVLKSLWSCSGRGVKFINGDLTENEKGWVRNILAEQGAIMIEPEYNKVLDFAMEFYVDKHCVEYIGLNIFETQNGKYLRNVNGTPEEKMKILSSYVPVETIAELKDSIIEITEDCFHDIYEGPFGIDMMIIRDAENKTKVHPCVEMNLRHTMGCPTKPPLRGEDV